VVAAACLTLKGGRTDWLVEKATELGAHSLLPLITARSQAGTNKDKFKALTNKAGQQKRQRSSADDLDGSSSSSSEFQASRLERLAIAATKQSLRAHGLQVQPAMSLEALLPQLQSAPVSLVAMAGAPPVLQVLQEHWQHTHRQQQQQGSPQAHLPAGQQQQQATAEQSIYGAAAASQPW
jgi:16S rRNA (uracil1498-N3)-methyltransferase